MMYWPAVVHVPDVEDHLPSRVFPMKALCGFSFHNTPYAIATSAGRITQVRTADPAESYFHYMSRERDILAMQRGSWCPMCSLLRHMDSSCA